MAAISVQSVSKTFTMHLQGGAKFAALQDISLAVESGTCVVLQGASGSGKSTLLKMIYGAYRCDAGQIYVQDLEERVDVATAGPRRILQLRRRSLGYVSQFLRAIPRVGALELVMGEARLCGIPDDKARKRASELLERLNVPARLWDLAPATFSGGEQQRVNIARGLVSSRPVLLLDETTASLDATNRDAVEELIKERRGAGVAMLAILHDEIIRERVADRIFVMPTKCADGATDGQS